MRRAIAAFFAAVILLVLAAPALAQSSSGLEDQVVLSGRVDVREGEQARNVVVFHGPVTIQGDVQGSLVVFDGAVTVSGSVRDNVVVFNGTLSLESGARVGGDVVTRQQPSIAPDATVGGQVKRVKSVFNGLGFRLVVRYAVWLGYTISTLLLGLLLVLLLVPRGMEVVQATGRAAVGPSMGWGLALFFGLPAVAILALVIVVAIPFGLALLMGLWLLYTVGYVACSLVVGRIVVKSPERRASAFFAGWGILRALALAPFLAGILWTLATIFGLGAILVAVWRARRLAVPPPPPPVPAEAAP